MRHAELCRKSVFWEQTSLVKQTFLILVVRALFVTDGKIAAQSGRKHSPPVAEKSAPEPDPDSSIAESKSLKSASSTPAVQTKVRLIIEINSDRYRSDEFRLQEVASQLIKRFREYPGVDAGNELFFTLDGAPPGDMREFRIRLSGLRDPEKEYERENSYYSNQRNKKKDNRKNACRIDRADEVQYVLYDKSTGKKVFDDNVSVNGNTVGPLETILLGAPNGGLTRLQQIGHVLADKIVAGLQKRTMY